MTANLNAALAHVSEGHAVFPCSPDKKPRVKKWRDESTTDTETIKSWWAQAPDSLVGIDLAKCSMFVVDCDRHGGPDGVAAWELLCVAYEHDTNQNYVVNTPSGGQHVYFSQDPGNALGNRTGDLPQGIDVRGSGGYVIAGGSVLPDGRIYKVTNRGTLPVVPAWLQTLINKQQPDPTPDKAPQTRHEVPTDRERRYAAVALTEEVSKVSTSTEGSRNTTLNTAAFKIGTLVGAGWLDEYEATSALEVAAFMCGLDGDEIARTVKSGIADGKKKPRAPLPNWPEGFDMRSDGLYRTGGKHDGEWICGPFTVLGEARTPDSKGWSIYLSWLDGDVRLHKHALKRSDLMSMTNDALKLLVDGGLKIAANRASDLKGCLAQISTNQRVRIVDRTGWHEQARFVMPTKTIGHDVREAVVYDGPDLSTVYSESGTIDDWKREIASLAYGNHRIMFAIGVAVAGPVVDLLKEDSLGFNYVGPSSSGKSTALRAAASVWGDKTFVKQWRTTDNGIESTAKAHSGTLLVLDELGQLDDRNAANAAYLLGNGTGKSRANRDGSARKASQWSLAVLSSGETTLLEKTKVTGKRGKAGQTVRMIDIPADAGKRMGLFEDTKGMAPDKFAESLTERSSTFFGTVGPALVQAIASNPSASIRQLRTSIDRLAASLLADARSSEGQVARMARRFAIVAAAGEFLNDTLGQPWQQGAMSTAARICFQAVLGRRGGTNSAEYTELIDAICEVVEKYGESPRFRDFTNNPFNQISSDASAVLNEKSRNFHHDGFLGYHGFHDGEEVWAFTETAFRGIVSGILEPRMAAQMLAEKGASVFHVSDGRYRWTKKIGNGTKKLYAIKATALEAD